MVYTQGIMRNVVLLGVVLSIVLVTAWLLLRQSPYQNRPVSQILGISSLNEEKLPASNQNSAGQNRNASTTYAGMSELFDPRLVFANTTLTFTEDNTFILEASDFNLSLLGNPELRVQNQYPVLGIRAFGEVEPDPNGEVVVLRLQNIENTFEIREENEPSPVSSVTAQRLQNTLRDQNVTLPEPSPSQPYEVALKPSSSPFRLSPVSEDTGYVVFVQTRDFF